MLSRRERLTIVAVVIIYGAFDVGSTWLVLGTGSGYETNPFAVAMMEQFGMYAGLILQKSIALILLVLVFVTHWRLLDYFADQLDVYGRIVIAAGYTVPAYTLFVGLQLTVRNLGNIRLPL